MTKKDFEAIAEVILNLDLPPNITVTIAMAFAKMLKTKNPNFDHGKFMAACLGD